MLFLNAGHVNIGNFHEMSDEEVQQSLMINSMQPVYTMKVLVDQMIKRNHLAAMVVTSSGLGSTAIPGCTNYSGEKSLAGYLAEGLDFELKGKVDCLNWQSGKVSTKMNGEKPGGHCVTTTVAVKGMLRDVGKESLTYGCFTHAKGMGSLSVMPEGLVKSFFYKHLCADREKQLQMRKEEEEKKAKQ